MSFYGPETIYVLKIQQQPSWTAFLCGLLAWPSWVNFFCDLPMGSSFKMGSIGIHIFVTKASIQY